MWVAGFCCLECVLAAPIPIPRVCTPKKIDVLFVRQSVHLPNCAKVPNTWDLILANDKQESKQGTPLSPSAMNSRFLCGHSATDVFLLLNPVRFMVNLCWLKSPIRFQTEEKSIHHKI